MAKRATRASLSKLEEQRAALEEQIRELRRKERQEQATLERKRHEILGRALAKELAENEKLAAMLEPILNARVTRPREREILELAPLSPKDRTDVP